MARTVVYVVFFRRSCPTLITTNRWNGKLRPHQLVSSTSSTLCRPFTMFLTYPYGSIQRRNVSLSTISNPEFSSRCGEHVSDRATVTPTKMSRTSQRTSKMSRMSQQKYRETRFRNPELRSVGARVIRIRRNVTFHVEARSTRRLRQIENTNPRLRRLSTPTN